MNDFSLCATGAVADTIPDLGKTRQDVNVTTDFIAPYWLVILTVVICLSPLLNTWGVSIASSSDYFDIKQLAQWNLSEALIIDEMFYALRGGTHHALAEWSAVVIAFVCIIMAFAHYSISRDITAPVLGIALVMSGSMDTVHTLAATRVIDAIADNNNLIPFTWAVSRSFNALVLFLGVGLILLSKKKHLKLGITEIAIFSAVLAILVYVLAKWMAESEHLPQTQFPGNWISRPYDILPMTLFIVCLPLYWMLYKQNSNYLTIAIFIGLLPDIASEAYMAFGSGQLFDHYFNSAHGLKVFSYTLPLLGYMLDYRFIFKKREQEQHILEELNSSLKNSETRVRTINELLPIGLLIVDKEGIVTSVNDYVLNLFEFTEAELLGKSVETLIPLEAREKHKILRENFQSKPDNRRMAGNIDFLKGRTKSNYDIALEINLGPITLDNQQQTLVSLLDIRERKKLVDNLLLSNEQMDQAIVKLSHSNEQLERFAFVCSHDLQEPVRMVESFSQLLEEKFKDQLEGKGLEYLKYITDGAHRSREMITDILTFCRLDQAPHSLEPVSLNDICRQVLTTLEASLQQKNGSFTWDENLPTINSVPTQVFQLVLNLVNNGLKFNREKKPHVHLSTSQSKESWAIEIKDNGIGINKKYQDQIFQIFERLNSKSEFSGTGMGLAICKKIAEQNGATICIKSEEGQGSTFIIEWSHGSPQSEDKETS